MKAAYYFANIRTQLPKKKHKGMDRKTRKLTW